MNKAMRRYRSLSLGTRTTLKTRRGTAMLVKSIMTREVKSCAPETSLSAAARIMSSRDCGIVPVVDAQQKLLGVITDRDVCLAVATRFRSPEELPARDVM